jgi:hypothetical protein
LFADHFGSHLQRQGTVDDFPLPSPKADKPAVRAKGNPPVEASERPLISPDGSVRWNGHDKRFAYLAGSTSNAFDGQTLAVTLPTSFHVYIIACTAPNAIDQVASTA